MARFEQAQPGLSLSDTAVVFLDVDGVLNTVASTMTELDPAALGRLKGVLDAVPGARIVLSTSWRQHPPMVKLLLQKLAEAGVPQATVIGATPTRPLPRKSLAERAGGAAPSSARELCDMMSARVAELSSQRADEICACLRASPPKAWVALDDLPLSMLDDDDDDDEARMHGSMERDAYSLASLRAAQRTRQAVALPRAHFVRTSDLEGLSEARAARAIELLRAQLDGSGAAPAERTSTTGAPA